MQDNCYTARNTAAVAASNVYSSSTYVLPNFVPEALLACLQAGRHFDTYALAAVALSGTVRPCIIMASAPDDLGPQHLLQMPCTIWRSAAQLSLLSLLLLLLLH